jgi:hypothetical protein
MMHIQIFTIPVQYDTFKLIEITQLYLSKQTYLFNGQKFHQREH